MQIFALLSVLVLSVAANIPFFHKCKKIGPNLNQCLKKSMNKGYPDFVIANNMHDMPCNFHKNVPNLFEVWSNGSLKGFDIIRFDSVSVNFNQKTFDITYFQPKAIIAGDYKVIGDFLGLNLDNEGNSNATFSNGTYHYHFKYVIEQRYGGKYIKITSYSLTYEIEGLHFDIDSTSDPQKGEQIEMAYNNNWQLLNQFVKGAVGEVFSDTYTPIIQQFFDQHSLQSLFN